RRRFDGPGHTGTRERLFAHRPKRSTASWSWSSPNPQILPAGNQIVQSGKCGHEAGHIEEDLQLGNGHALPIAAKHRKDGYKVKHRRGLAVWRRLEHAPANHQD